MARYTVSTPAPDHSGAVGNLAFVDGSAIADDDIHAAALAYCRAAGYTVEPLPEEPAAEESEPVEPATPRKSTRRSKPDEEQS